MKKSRIAILIVLVTYIVILQFGIDVRQIDIQEIVDILEVEDIDPDEIKQIVGNLLPSEEQQVKNDDKERIVVDGEAVITFFDLDQRDSTLIQFDDYDILIDAGDRAYGQDIVKKLNDIGVDDIEYLIATHPHADHIGGMDDVLLNFEVEHFVMPDVAHTSKTYENMIDIIIEKDIEVIIPEYGDYLIDEKNASLKVISPNIEEDDNLNNYSICLKFDFGNTRAIFTGDAEKEIEEMILKSGENIRADIFQAGHHGSSTSNTKQFVNAISPSITVISAGEDNKYGHPHVETIEILKSVGSDIYITSELSDIQIKTNGDEIKVNY